MIESDAIADTEFWETVLKRLVVAKARHPPPPPPPVQSGHVSSIPPY